MNEPVARWLMAAPDHRELPSLDVLLRRPSWHIRAACRGNGAPLLFSDDPATLRVARAMCQLDCAPGMLFRRYGGRWSKGHLGGLQPRSGGIGAGHGCRESGARRTVPSANAVICLL